MASEFEAINDALSDFTFSASHDLMEPLRKISSFSGRLSEILGENLDERQQAYLSIIERSSLKMKRYIEDLGFFAGIARANLVFEEVNLEEVISTVLNKLSLVIRNSKAKITKKDLHTLVSDKNLLVELFKNIISNSLNFKKESDPPEVLIASQKTGDGFIEVRVEDSGMGFDEKYSDRIFKPFQRLHRHSQDERSGMGLAICKKIVERLGGTISSKGSPMKGAVFVVKLPLKPQNPR